MSAGVHILPDESRGASAVVNGQALFASRHGLRAESAESAETYRERPLDSSASEGAHA